MTPEEWHKIKEVLQNALEIDPQGRSNFLDSACAGQAFVRTEVEELLRSHDEDRVFLEQPAMIDASDMAHAAASATWTGKRLGPYQILEQIGEGGMGAVYHAVRADGMYDKQVAIKLIRGGFSRTSSSHASKMSARFSLLSSIPTLRGSSTAELMMKECLTLYSNSLRELPSTNTAIVTTYQYLTG